MIRTAVLGSETFRDGIPRAYNFVLRCSNFTFTTAFHIISEF